MEQKFPSIKLIVGLGNNGPKYKKTPHNIGFNVIDELKKDPPARKVGLEKSEGYMNTSGPSVRKLAQQFNCNPTELLIVCDDIDLPRGQTRIRLQGSSGGHNGLKSVFQAFGGRTDIPRLRIGVGREGGNLAEYVLDTKYFVELSVGILRGAAAVRMIVDLGFEKAMNEFNKVFE